MDTNKIKSFAREARLLLLDGVFQRLKYWGFNHDGSNSETLQTTQGGYIFRGQVYTDTTVPKKWEKLKKRISNEQDVKDVIEEAAYTWFNRLMAIKILEVNGYLAPTLEFAQDIQIPVLVQNAKRGQHNLSKQADKDLLLEYLQEDKEEQAFGLLVAELCNTNNLLHDVFGKIDDYTEILLPQNLMQTEGLLELINSEVISEADFKEVELIGWLYQFYISDKKNEVFAGFKKKKKARAEDIPAATQIFTPKWIVKYMVENTVGKIYLDYEPDSTLKSNLKYLVENNSEKDNEPIISDITELTLIDPACGSGHILVTGFELLFQMYREEGYTAKQAVDSILKNNIFGLDIDDRAMQLARFAVLLKAAKFDAEVLNRSIIPNIYSFPENTLTDSFSEQYYSKAQSDWFELRGMKLKQMVSLNWTEIVIDRKTKKEKQVAKSVVFREGTILHNDDVNLLISHCEESIKVDYSENLERFWGSDKMGYAYSQFFYAIQLLQQGKNLGSTTKLNLCEEALEHIKLKYQEWNNLNSKLQLGAFDKLLWDNLKPHIEVLFILTKRYTSVVANPPYMGLKSMNSDLKEYVNDIYPLSSTDLFAVFMEVCLKLNCSSGLMGMINQHSWMFLSSYEMLRKKIISDFSILNMIHLGSRTFEELSGEVVQSTAFVIKKNNEISDGIYYRLVSYRNNLEKENQFLKGCNQYKNIRKENFLKIPGNSIAYWVSDNILNCFSQPNLTEYAHSFQGIITGNNKNLLRFWHEINRSSITLNFNDYEDSVGITTWIPYQKGGSFRRWYGNNEYMLFWNGEGNHLTRARTENREYYFKNGITWSFLTGDNYGCRETGEGNLWDVAGSSFFPENENNIEPLLGLYNSKVIQLFLNLLNPTLNYQVENVLACPIIASIFNNDEIKEFVNNNKQISKSDWDSSEISWEFEKSPLFNAQNSLSEAFNYWCKNVTQNFFQLHANEEKLNRIFIEIYGLEEELTPEVPLKDITILQDELDRKDLEALEPKFREDGKDAIELPINKQEILSQFISYALGVFLGRYRLDKPGLNIAHLKASDDEIEPYTHNGHKIEIDDDGILPIMGEDCAFPDDALVRTKDLIHAIWGEDTLTDNINFLHDCLGMDLHKWLTEKFWGYHTSMYKKKPIYWLFSSDTKKPQNAAFKVLVYMHRMDKYTVQKIQRNYLHPHQEDIKRKIKKLEENELTLSRDEFKKLEKLRNWDIECRDYNEVLKELANQQIEFDLDDGVSVNYAKFEGAVAKI
ncbi:MULTISPECIES: BREX-1 system adenine-specific DNA-methyltransferase PglX [unclassified Carboxylicivirga]|uniref:BREX-1 system adenine-specific DNA-methyltransferase PglX n=1 Tax=Carboxylicivirga TaxID=1628153 RepID=UPI003D32C4CD